MHRKGLIFILVGPSGVGKNTLLFNVRQQVPNLMQMPTGTTRPRRPGETEKQHLFFTDEEFDRLVHEGAFLEWQVVHGKRYGMLKSIIEQGIHSGKDYIADVEVLGAFDLKKAYPDNVVLIFIRPPVMDVLEQRIRQRDPHISDEELAMRVGRAQFEMSFMDKCDHIIVNDNIDTTTIQLKRIVLAERSRGELVNERVREG